MKDFLRKNPSPGNIINMSSSVGWMASNGGEAHYCAAKAGIMAFTRAVAAEVAGKGIRVNAIAPTFIKTPMSIPWLKDRAFKKFVTSRIPWGRLGQPEDVVGAVLFLVSDSADLITGTTLLIDGGWTAQ